MHKGFAVLDFETTGLFPSRHNRVIEIGLVLTDSLGRMQEKWETLINPGRDLGKQAIHGIRASEVLDAPLFEDVAEFLVKKLSGRALVAHNAEFDSKFLMAELERAGYEIWQQPEFMCTMRLAKQFLPGTGRALRDCCDALDIEIGQAHRAINDALATSQLLESFIASSNSSIWMSALKAAAEYEWPETRPLGGPDQIVGTGIKLKTRALEEKHDITANDFLERITVKLPEVAGPESFTNYLGMLDKALFDRHISVTEAGNLVELAESLGIDRKTVQRLHQEYFSAVSAVAWSDGLLTDEELEDLSQVARLLDIPEEQIRKAVQEPRHRIDVDYSFSDVEGHMGASIHHAFQLELGDLIVLTGEMSMARSEIETRIIAAGYIPHSAVTKKVKLLVAADPDSLSGKARKARDYGIAVIGESTLWKLLNQ